MTARGTFEVKVTPERRPCPRRIFPFRFAGQSEAMGRAHRQLKLQTADSIEVRPTMMPGSSG